MIDKPAGIFIFDSEDNVGPPEVYCLYMGEHRHRYF